MKQITLPSGEYLLVDVGRAKSFTTQHGKLDTWVDDKKTWWPICLLPSGNWQIIGKADSLGHIGNGELLIYLTENGYNLSTTLILEKVTSEK